MTVASGRGTVELPVQYVKGVGPQRAEVLKKVGVTTPAQLLTYYPRDHQDRRIVSIRELRPGAKRAIQAEVLSVDFKQVGKNLGQASARLKDATGEIQAIWFKRLSYKYDVFSAVKRVVAPGKRIFVYGSTEPGRDDLELRVEDFEEAMTDGTGLHVNRITPVYPLTEGLHDRWLREAIARTLPVLSGTIADPLPRAVQEQQKLLPLPEAVRLYHFPNSWSDRDRARERLAFDEFFFLELALATSRREREHQVKGVAFELNRKLLTPFRANLGYEFTRAQARVINEIFKDMGKPAPMNRLLQGDVGSGKTVVALSAALLAIENNHQVAFLAPTEILAGQHALSLTKFLADLPVKTALLTGSTPKPERKKILEQLEKGKIDLLVGTHAILNEDVRFARLGLAVIDEQHRFGVRQREKLLAKTSSSAGGDLIERVHPDVLIMTATPIPRTLALTLYGDLDVSVIDEMPAGRTPIRTMCASETAALDRIRRELEAGHQAYLVLPLVEESELLSKRTGKAVKAAVHEFARVQPLFPNHAAALLHGQMDPDEKKKVMDRFRSGEVRLLVATPVIEVGIDVPNATIIVIANPERFGLAQLHQLRGRVGRGSLASECVLMTSDLEEGAQKRMDLFCALSDGFRLAEEDLQLRGPGEFIGEAQHGVPLFRVGDLLKDALLIARARNAATELADGSIPLAMPEFRILNRTLVERFGTKIPLLHVG